LLGRELQVKSGASGDLVREVETYVSAKLAEAEAMVKSGDSQIVAILTLMNIAEDYLTMLNEHEACRQSGAERMSRLLQLIDGADERSSRV
jgi:cell division protein ZapA